MNETYPEQCCRQHSKQHGIDSKGGAFIKPASKEDSLLIEANERLKRRRADNNTHKYQPKTLGKAPARPLSKEESQKKRNDYLKSLRYRRKS